MNKSLQSLFYFVLSFGFFVLTWNLVLPLGDRFGEKIFLVFSLGVIMILAFSLTNMLYRRWHLGISLLLGLGAFVVLLQLPTPGLLIW